METLKHGFKQFAEWVTAWRYRYGSDLFVRTTLYVIGLQALLVVVSIAMLSFALSYSDGEVLRAVAAHMPAGTNLRALDDAITAIQTHSIRLLFLGMVVLSTLFGILLAYASLRPARQSLHYQKLFISNVAHELRTPLSTIKTSTEVELFDPHLPAGIKKTFEGTIRELNRVSEIINNLLSLNRLLNPDEMEFKNIDLGPIIDSAVVRLADLAHERGVEVAVTKHEYRSVWGNATALEQVVTNLLKNAISFTPKDAGGLVTVSVGPDYQGSVLFSVSDNGIGIGKRDLFHIFEPFYRADISRNRAVSKSGSGLGLTIVNEITRAHHGKIHIQSAPRKGTTVSIVLPPGAGAAERNNAGMSQMSVDFS